MKKIFFLFCLLPSILFGKNIDSTRFSIIKLTVEYLAHDTKLAKNGYRGVSNCENDYNCLKEYCNSNKDTLDGVCPLIDKWSKISVDLLKEVIYKDVFDRNGKEYRKEGDPFKNYENELANIIDGAGKKSDSTRTVSDTNSSFKTINEKIKSFEDRLKWNSKLLYLSLLLGLISLLLGILNFIRGKNTSTSQPKPGSASRYEGLAKDLQQLREEIARKQNVDIQPLESRLNQIEEKLKSPITPPLKIQEPFIEKNTNTIIQNTKSNINSQTVFAKIPDMGNGFSSSIIVDNQNGEQIYVIEIRGDKASFSISSDDDVQKFALSDFNFYLGNACNYPNQPIKNSRIKTHAKGTLIKSGSNWIIDDKAKIEFI